VKSFTGDTISIKTDDKNNVEITDGSAKFKLKGQPGEEFPMPPVIDKNDRKLTVNSAVFKNMIKKTIFSVATDDSRPILTGELIKIENNILNVVAIDGFRVSWQREPIDYAENISMVVPAKALAEVSRLLPVDEESKTDIYFTEKHAMFEFKGCKIVSRLLEGEFLNYENLFNVDNKTEMIIQKGMLTSALQRTTIISNDTKNPRVNMNIANNVLVIDANDDRGNMHEELNAETNGDELNISFNSRYLLDILGAVDEEMVSFNFMTEKSPCIVKSVTGKEYKYLVLPLLQF
jgi:DNA polymerase-3 subunit beta